MACFKKINFGGKITNPNLACCWHCVAHQNKIILGAVFMELGLYGVSDVLKEGTDHELQKRAVQRNLR
jgi:hypothetical protein